MNQKKLRVMHYMNQFFGQEGHEDRADMKFLVKEGPVGPGLALQKILGEEGEIIATIICGDNYFAENIHKASEEAVKLIGPYAPNLFFAGPAFEAGRYGIACGAICKIVQERFGIPAITGISEENPGVELYRRDVYICRTERSALRMVESLSNMANLALKLISKEKGSKLVSGENIGRPSEDGYFSRGVVKNEHTQKATAERAIDILLVKVQGKPFQTELEMVNFGVIKPPAPMRKNLSLCQIALISDGGLVPKGNPGGLKARGNLVWSGYEIENFLPEDFSSANYEVAHTGYYSAHVLANPNRLVPADILRDLEKEGIIGKLHPIFYSTSGNATDYKRCGEMGEEILKELKNKGVDGAILTST